MVANLELSVEELADIENKEREDVDEDSDDEKDGEDKKKQEQGLEHPCHMHKLILRILSENCQVECSLCKLEIHGPAYCCEGCIYFLHGSCALIELPPQIQHPSHPLHPLTLDGETYKCSKCSTSPMQVFTAIATLPPEDDKCLDEDDAEEDEHNNEKDGEEPNKEQQEDTGTIWHFPHKEHPLASFHIKIQLSTECRGCMKRIYGQVYGCRACLFLLHASCARSPQAIDHHPFGSGFSLAQLDDDLEDDKCGACAQDIKAGFVYSRRDDLGGWFRLHMACALSTRFPPSHQDMNSADFKVHQCSLVLFHIEEETYAPIPCRVCELKISGEARGCIKCGYILHKSCTEKLQELDVINHFLHPDHPNFVLQALQVRGDSTSRFYGCCCTNCVGAYRPPPDPNLMVFQCDSCEFFLNLNCALQTLSAVEEGVAASILHFAHDHPLLLHFIREYSYQTECLVCREELDGLAYWSVNSETSDSFGLHKSCAELPQELRHPFHPQHLLVLLSKTSVGYGYFHCSACRKKLEGFAYYCAECEFYLDTRCASLKLTLKHPRHEHKLAYFKETMRINVGCNVCGETCNKDLYHCALCNFNLHYDCLPLPPVITHEGHWLHPLFLRDEIVDGDPNYQYCDHCEELRNPKHGVYHCEECGFSGHIDCMISKDKVDAEEEAKEVEANTTEVEPIEVKKPVSSQANSKGARLKAMIDGSRRNINTMRGSLSALMKELEELEKERKRL